MYRRRKLHAWASKLTKEQLIEVAIISINQGIEAEQFSFYADSLAPYWSDSGEPIVVGQQPFKEDN